MEEEKKWNIYMVTMKNGNIYTGISNNILKRFETHCNEKGAKCLRGKGPLNYRGLVKLTIHNVVQDVTRCDKMR